MRAVLLIAIGCASSREPPPLAANLGEIHVVPRAPASQGSSHHSGRLRYHMQDHIDDLRELQRLLVGGKLAEAKALAFMLTRPPPDLAWSVDTTRTGVVAWSLSTATTVAEAAERMTHLAAACGACHLRAGASIELGPSLQPEPARHAWAASRLLEGLVTGSDVRWRSALDVFASGIVGKDLQAQARAGLARIPLDTLADRRRAYQRMLTACLDCHREATR